MLRNNFSQQAAAVIHAWGQIAISCCLGVAQTVSKSRMTVKVQWTAHDGVVMKADWNPVTNLVVTGGEDRRYKYDTR